LIKLWAFDFSEIQGRTPPDYDDPRIVQGAFDSNLARLASLEALGFEGVFFSEHHFLGLLCPSPNLLIAALAKMSHSLKLGVMGAVLALHQPWRLAEELGMLDYLTEGRLEIGVSSGVPPEFPVVGIPPEEIRARYEETLDYLDNAFAHGVVRHHGKLWTFEGVPVLPRLRPEARRRKWMTVFTPESAAAGARRGYKLCTGFQSTEKVAAVYDVYRGAAGWDAGPDDLGLRRQVLICETDEAAQALGHELLAIAQGRIAASAERLLARTPGDPTAAISDDVRRSGVMDAPSPGPAQKPSLMRPGLMSTEDEYIFGSPATVAERIVQQCRTAGVGNFLAYHPNGLEQGELDVNYRLWSKVAPVLAKAEVARAVA
jgi:alkanesulfonate monooxygenase SsuD/methylene tetrahydromethanopterin reductase-like flavin-dependent oxidoreductase (luciferase family)